MIGKEDYVTPKPGILTTYNGSFDLDNLYKEIKKWFKNNNYKLYEKEYKEKRRAHGDELIIDILSERKIDDYIKFHINVKFLMIHLKKLSKESYIGNVHCNLKGYIEFDYNKKWQINKLKEFLMFIYNNFIIKGKIQNVYEDKLYDEVLKVEDLIKRNLGMI